MMGRNKKLKSYQATSEEQESARRLIQIRNVCFVEEGNYVNNIKHEDRVGAWD